MWKTSFKICLIISLAAVCFLVWNKFYDLFKETEYINSNNNGQLKQQSIKEFTDAVWDGDLKKVKYMVKEGQDVNAVDDLDNSAINTIGTLIYSDYKAKKHRDVIEYLLGNGLNANVKINGDTLLHRAVMYKNYETIELLYAAGIDMNILDDKGKTPMMRMFEVDPTTSEELIKMYNYLKDRKADTNYKDPLGFTVLTYANISDKEEMTVYLRTKNLAGDIKNNSEAINVLDKLAINNQEDFNKTVSLNNLGLVRVFLLAGYNPNVNSQKQTLIDLASSEDYVEMMDLLLNYGADPNTMNDNENTVLFYAAYFNNPKLVKVLLHHGAKDLPNKSGYNALRIAKEDGNSDIIEMLKNSEEEIESGYPQDEGLKIRNKSLEKNEKSSVIDFIHKYIEEGLNAITENDFSHIENYLDPNGKAYKQSRISIQEANLTGKSQDLLLYEGKQVIPINEHTYKVVTFEEYRITYANGTQEINGYNSEYIVVKMSNGTFALNETVKVEKLYSNSDVE